MKTIPINSSNIKAIFYDDTSKKLLVFFYHNSLYTYTISEKQVSEFMNAEDKGKYFYENIRMSCPYKKIY